MADLDLPSRLFADREEPAGDRVNMYFKLNTIKAVLKALTPKEIETIRPCFGTLLDLYSKPVFSGKLAHFLLTRQLSVIKRHEIWIVFAGKPIRFSLREFGLVTGLNCNPLPPLDKSLIKSPPGVTPYWFTLFGGEEWVTGEMLLTKLRRSKALDSDIRIKYACLLLVDGFLSRRSYHMKIPKSHVEMIRDLDVFLAYPWGRYSFDLTMRCIKSRSVSQLAQATVAIQGFIHALVLVFVEAVPAVLSTVAAGTDPESGDDDPFPVIYLNLDTVWDLDGEEEVDVRAIIPSDPLQSGLEDCSWPDEVGDPCVDLILQQWEDGAKFRRGMFGGGIRASDVQVDPPPRVISKSSKGKRKLRSKVAESSQSRGESSRSKKSKIRCPRPRTSTAEPSILEAVASQIKAGLKDGQSDVFAHVCVELKSMELRLERSMKANISSAVSAAISDHLVVGKVLREVIGGSGQPYEPTTKDIPPVNPQTDLQPPQAVIPTQNTALQNQQHPQPQAVIPTPNTDHQNQPFPQPQPPFPCNLNEGVLEQPDAEESGEEGEASSTGSESRSRSQQSEHANESVPNGDGADSADGVVSAEASPMSDKFKQLMATVKPQMNFVFGEGVVLQGCDLLKIPTLISPEHPEVMDACVSVLRESLFHNNDPDTDSRADLLPCKFHGSLAVLYGKFKKCRCKESFEFDSAIIGDIAARFKATGTEWLTDIDSLLSPFNIDKNRWIAVHIDLPSHSLTVFDPTAAARRGSRLKPELEFICEMFPYLVRTVGQNEAQKNYPLHPLSFTRNTRVSQASTLATSGMLSLFFLEAYATGGFEKVLLVKESGLRQRAELLAVEMYEHCLGDLDAA
ncbi:Ulp1 protease family C-terminal catalytic domain [Arabidopsis thaliana x Arabidopsis arenosa]|uniref:Ulp1 protease family C-terminal catalytic domain n=1 Tax=Arabidopsis thaliana x Arabidopsis arenosa TaxID=1240361 RepID=A0A8T1XHW7_9BRAS|nr:Ulp1 protease family C-terminal catalytic domain [Arabidopsis thaliana x Arabidopsis arenosa]